MKRLLQIIEGEMQALINDSTRPLKKEKALDLVKFLASKGIAAKVGKSDYQGGYGWREPRYNVYWEYDKNLFDKVVNLYTEWEMK